MVLHVQSKAIGATNREGPRSLIMPIKDIIRPRRRQSDLQNFVGIKSLKNVPTQLVVPYPFIRIRLKQVSHTTTGSSSAPGRDPEIPTRYPIITPNLNTILTGAGLGIFITAQNGNFASNIKV